MSFNLHTDYNGKITKKDLKKVFWRSIPMEHSWNYERMDNVGYAWALYPVLKKLYPDEKDLAKAMKRHLTLYNMTPYICTFPMGISVAMEEANAEQEDFDTESIGSVKTAMMGPLSGIGDAFFWGTLRVIATSIGCALAIKGNILGPILFMLIFNVPHYFLRYIGTFFGYKLGSESISKITASGLMSKVTEAASIVGMMVTGAMTMDMTAINLVTKIGSGDEATTLQELIEGIMPGLPVLGIFGIVYWMLKKKMSPLLIMLIMLIVSIAGAYFGFLG